jgi:predicted nucleic acid-binding protein
MSEPSGPYLFDVGVVALAHAETPVSDTALDYVRRAVVGDIDAVVPLSAVYGAHVVLTNYYDYSNPAASRLMRKFTEAGRIHWYEELPTETVRAGLARAAELNVGGWDGYYAQVAVEEGVETILTLDDDFSDLDGVEAEVILSADEFATLNDFLDG